MPAAPAPTTSASTSTVAVPSDVRGVEIGISPPTQSPRTRASGNNILILPERKRLQSKDRYVDAKPHIRQLKEVLLQRTAGPYIWVIRVASARSRRSRHVRYASTSDIDAEELGNRESAFSGCCVQGAGGWRSI